MSAKKKTRKKKKSANTARAKKTMPKKKAAGKKKAGGKKKLSKKKTRVRGKSEIVDRFVFEPKGLGPRSGGQSGDLQGLSELESAGSESVGELLEEGNAFEAEVVKGVEDVSEADEEEVTTHEVPEDDVPEEYREER
ncbi:MAG TPA: hypothetical protein VG051_03080 [Candidatus Acidoferrum sp.]|jgi:hypothetical protein|nr:hypothetical protein [Candidatus Acidoferrum sp.]